MAARVPLIRIPVSIAGMVLTTISAALFIVVLLADLFGLHTNPYRGLVICLRLQQGRFPDLYELTPDTTLPSVVQLPSVRNRLQTATVDACYYLTCRTAVGVVYWFDKYEVRDFATEPETLTASRSHRS
jgi:hypothetical protein